MKKEFDLPTTVAQRELTLIEGNVQIMWTHKMKSYMGIKQVGFY